MIVRMFFFLIVGFSNFVPLLDTLSLYFQIRDDYANLLSEEVRNCVSNDFNIHNFPPPPLLLRLRVQLTLHFKC